MKYLYSQKDIKWDNLKVGNSGKTMAQIGCLLTNCAMVISDLMNDRTTPEEVLLWMNINKGFTDTGDLKWDILLDFLPEKYNFRQGKGLKDETQYEMYAVWAGKIKHWILKDGDQWIDPLKGAYISKNYYSFQGDIRLLSGKKLFSMNYEKRIVQNTEANTPDAGQFSFIQDGKRRIIKQERAGLACLSVIDKEGEKVFALNSKTYHEIPLGKDF